jgi:diketogulonate reductase-like aldo/keto reductase
MEEAVAAGEAASIGLCNCTPGVIKQILAVCAVRPAVNQVRAMNALGLELLIYIGAINTLGRYRRYAR